MSPRRRNSSIASRTGAREWSISLLRHGYGSATSARCPVRGAACVDFLLALHRPALRALVDIAVLVVVDDLPVVVALLCHAVPPPRSQSALHQRLDRRAVRYDGSRSRRTQG